MLAKHIAAGIAGSLLLASTAFAAENSSATYQGDWRTSKVVGLNVYNDQNENVGSINDLLTDKSGNIKAAVLSVGGFLGMGSRYVAIPYEKLKFSEQPGAFDRRWCIEHDARPAVFKHDDGLGSKSASRDTRFKAQSLVSGSRDVQRDQG